jgi:hypothetical protein
MANIEAGLLLRHTHFTFRLRVDQDLGHSFLQTHIHCRALLHRREHCIRSCYIVHSALILCKSVLLYRLLATDIISQTVLFCARGVSAFWTMPPMLEGTQYVVNPPALIIAYAIIDIVLDVGILAMPLPVIRRLKLSRTKRTAVAGVFLLGALYVSQACNLARSNANIPPAG